MNRAERDTGAQMSVRLFTVQSQKNNRTREARICRGLSLLAVCTVCTLLAACGGGFEGSSFEGSVAGTGNPLVARYTVASACTGQAMVEFGTDTSYGRSTSWYPVAGYYRKTTILVAGMRAGTTYHMRAQLQCAGATVSTADTTFTSGALPSSAKFPVLQVTRPDPPEPNLEGPGIELVDTIGPTANLMQLYFTDRDANPIWYYNIDPSYYPFTVKQLSNSHLILSLTSNQLSPGSTLREVDLAGTTVREMTIDALQQKVQTAGFDFVPAGYHHDLLPLENGHLIVLVNCFKDFSDLPGYSGTITVQGDAVIDLDENWNAVWAWNSFDYLDVNRHLAPALSNNVLDWTHSNALVYSPADGNILVSMRHQSWILKLDYNNGAGTGSVLWRLGYQGDFALTEEGIATADPSAWFSYQHFPTVVGQSGTQTTLGVWDNGDYRVLNAGGSLCTIPGPPECYSRATIFQIDESSMVADLSWQYLPGYFSVWGGSQVQLSNGNIEFDLNAPLTAPGPNVASEVQEVTQTSTPQVVWKMDIPVPMYAYRAYRVPSLYPGVTWQY
jgi:arylsulfate sulfotransferase